MSNEYRSDKHIYDDAGNAGLYSKGEIPVDDLIPYGLWRNKIAGQ